MYKFKNDRYKSVRGGHAQLLDITCAHCTNHICFYQKDGPGSLRRLYLDRIVDRETESKELICKECQRLLGVRIIFEKENRLAYRLIPAATKKKAASQREIV